MIITFLITLFAFLSFSRFQLGKEPSLNTSQIFLISLSFAAMSIYLNIADGRVFVWHATDGILDALFLAVRRVSGLVAVMSVLKSIFQNAKCLAFCTPGIRPGEFVPVKILRRARY